MRLKDKYNDFSLEEDVPQLPQSLTKYGNFLKFPRYWKKNTDCYNNLDLHV